MRTLIALCLLVFVLAGCASKIEGETSNPPPAGGPGASASHPPGLTKEEIAEDAKH
ncbi:MAG: hypothetical protein J0H02_18425 [Armatimonadetes bacterium]|nr:hypothetical protein [Armatimonadota bacterium]